MKKDNQLYLQDIIEAIEKIEQYVENKKFDDFAGNAMMQDAVIRQFEIIGESAKRLTPDFLESHKDFPFKKAIAMRNLLIHEYDYINVESVWKTIKEDLPDFKDNINKILKKL